MPQIDLLANFLKEPTSVHSVQAQVGRLMGDVGIGLVDAARADAYSSIADNIHSSGFDMIDGARADVGWTKIGEFLHSIFEVPGASVREGIRGAVDPNRSFAEGYTEGAVKGSETFQDELLRRFSPKTTSVALNFMGGLPASILGLGADLVTDPTNLFLNLVGLEAMKKMSASKSGDAVMNFMNKERKIPVGLSIEDVSSKGNKLADMAEAKAIKEFGLTEIPEEGGFITRNGKVIDASGKLQTDFNNRKYVTGRNVDHREIAQAAFDEHLSPIDALVKYQDLTNNTRIGIVGDTLHIDTIHPLTDSQMEKIRQISIKKNIIADITGKDTLVKSSGEFNRFLDFKKFHDEYFNIGKNSKLLGYAGGYLSLVDKKLGSIKEGQVIEGEASTYGWGEKLNPNTFSGEKFNPDGVTVAMRDVPMGSKVEITDKKTGKKVIAKVNDGGPNIRTKRVVDLSKGAWKALGYKEAGLANVEVRILEKGKGKEFKQSIKKNSGKKNGKK